MQETSPLTITTTPNAVLSYDFEAIRYVVTGAHAGRAAMQVKIEAGGKVVPLAGQVDAQVKEDTHEQALLAVEPPEQPPQASPEPPEQPKQIERPKLPQQPERPELPEQSAPDPAHEARILSAIESVVAPETTAPPDSPADKRKKAVIKPMDAEDLAAHRDALERLHAAPPEDLPEAVRIKNPFNHNREMRADLQAQRRAEVIERLEAKLAKNDRAVAVQQRREQIAEHNAGLEARETGKAKRDAARQVYLADAAAEQKAAKHERNAVRRKYITRQKLRMGEGQYKLFKKEVGARADAHIEAMFGPMPEDRTRDEAGADHYADEMLGPAEHADEGVVDTAKLQAERAGQPAPDQIKNEETGEALREFWRQAGAERPAEPAAEANEPPADEPAAGPAAAACAEEQPWRTARLLPALPAEPGQAGTGFDVAEALKLRVLTIQVKAARAEYGRMSAGRGRRSFRFKGGFSKEAVAQARESYETLSKKLIAQERSMALQAGVSPELLEDNEELDNYSEYFAVGEAELIAANIGRQRLLATGKSPKGNPPVQLV